MLARLGVHWLLRSRVVNGAVRALAQARGHRLVLVYHRLGAIVSPSCQVVPTVPVDVFRAHLQALAEIVDLVTLDEILAPQSARPHADIIGRRLSVALTFDDDLPSHVTQVLPTLREMHMPAAFFLSGRALHGLGPYWFQQLEALLVAYGRGRTAALLGIPSATPAPLALACEQNADMRRRVAELSADLPSPEILQRDDVAALSGAGMTIGFHTVDHGILPAMSDAALEAALADGRNQLVDAADAPVRFFAYPHGKADARSARAVRRGGFDAAFTGRPEPLGHHQDRYSVGRWEPGPIAVDDLLIKLAVRLHRASPPAPTMGIES